MPRRRKGIAARKKPENKYVYSDGEEVSSLASLQPRQMLRARQARFRAQAQARTQVQAQRAQAQPQLQLQAVEHGSDDGERERGPSRDKSHGTQGSAQDAADRAAALCLSEPPTQQPRQDSLKPAGPSHLTGHTIEEAVPDKSKLLPKPTTTKARRAPRKSKSKSTARHPIYKEPTPDKTDDEIADATDDGDTSARAHAELIAFLHRPTSPASPPSSPSSSPDIMSIPGGAFVPPNQQRNLRACMVCAIVRTYSQFMNGGCPNCEEFLELANNSDAITECTSQVFEGLMTIADTSRSWVARFQRLEGYVPGLYATQVEGILPDEVISAAEHAGINYVPRDGSETEMMPKDQ